MRSILFLLTALASGQAALAQPAHPAPAVPTLYPDPFFPNGQAPASPGRYPSGQVLQDLMLLHDPLCPACVTTKAYVDALAAVSAQRSANLADVADPAAALANLGGLGRANAFALPNLTSGGVVMGQSINIGNAPRSMLFGSDAFPGLEGSNVLIDVPASSPASGPTQAFGHAGYVRSAKSNVYPVGVFGAGFSNANNVNAWGLNSITSNCPTQNCTAGQGHDGIMFGWELDMSSGSRPDSSAPLGALYGIYATGIADKLPTGGADFAHISPFNPIGQYAPLPWTNGFLTEDGAVETGIDLGAVLPGPGHGSQPIKVSAIGMDGVRRTSTIAADASGNLVFTPGGGSTTVQGTLVAAGPVVVTAPPGAGARASYTVALTGVDAAGAPHQAGIVAGPDGGLIMLAAPGAGVSTSGTPITAGAVTAAGLVTANAGINSFGALGFGAPAGTGARNSYPIVQTGVDAGGALHQTQIVADSGGNVLIVPAPGAGVSTSGAPLISGAVIASGPMTGTQLGATGPMPTLNAVCGAATLMPGSNTTRGSVALPPGAQACTIAFAEPLTSAPFCVVSVSSVLAQASVVGTNPAGLLIGVQATSEAAGGPVAPTPTATVTWHCIQ